MFRTETPSLRNSPNGLENGFAGIVLRACVFFLILTARSRTAYRPLLSEDCLQAAIFRELPPDRYFYCHSSSMEESTVAMAIADVMVYDDGTKRWLSPDGCTEPARSQVRILHNSHTNAFRIVGTRMQDRQWILNCNIYERLKYNPATPMFHQWRDEKRKVYGLSFLSEEEARAFITVMTQALAAISSNNEYQNGADFGLSNGVYHEPQQLHHNAYSAPSFRDNDQDSICSAGMSTNGASAYRKSSQSVLSSSSGGAGLMLTNAQRRASQGSSSSSSNGSSGPTTIYASSSATCATNSPSRAPPAAAAANGPPPAPPLPPGGIAAINTNAPPAPPPPPPGALSGGKLGGISIAEQLKRVQLRKTSNASAYASSGNSQMPNKNESNIRGRGGLLSELEATLNKRKNQSEGIDSSSGDTIASSGTIRRPWEKPSAASLNGNSTAAGTESPKAHRKAPSGSSLSSQEEPKLVNGTGSSNSTVAVGNVSSSPGALTMEMLEKWKQELLNEVRLEINKAKKEIIEALQAELRKE